MRTARAILNVLLTFVWGASAFSEEIPYAIPETLTLSGQELVLNGYGERERWFMDVYNCALYLPHRSTSREFIMAATTPTAIRIRVIYDPPADVPDRWEETFQAELSNELFDRMTDVYEKLDVGDIVIFAYVPGQGTKAYRNDKLLFTDKGHGLMQGLLDQWIGPRPVSKNLRRLLLRN